MISECNTPGVTLANTRVWQCGAKVTLQHIKHRFIPLLLSTYIYNHHDITPYLLILWN